MRYAIASGLVLTALQLALAAPAASAQDLSSFGDFSLSPMRPPAPSKPRSLDKIVAVVNNGVILKSELDAETAQVRRQSGGATAHMPPNVLRSQVLDHMIMRRLQVQRAKKNHLKVSNDELNKGMARIAQKNHMTMPQFTQAVAQSGMSMQDLRHRVRQEILISKLRRRQVMSKVVVSDADVNRYLQNQALRAADPQYRLRQIVLHRTPEAGANPSQAARRAAESLRRRLVDGKADFATLARLKSQGPHADAGGQLGWLDGSELPERYAKIVPKLQPGDVSPVLAGPDGFYLLKLEAKRSGGKARGSGPKVTVQEVKMRHILLKPNAIRNDARTRKLARQIRERLQAGDSFAKLAKKYSDDGATANQGGDLGWVRVKRLGPDTRRQIDGLHDGQISRVFQDASGYEIVKVENHRRRDATKTARRDKARQALGEQRANEQGQLWLRTLRDEAYVDIRMPHYQPTAGR